MTGRSAVGAFLCVVLLASCARPLAEFSYQGDRSTAPALITFENLSKNADQYEWDFGDGNFSNDPA
ncbi:MAG: hypothetical protein D6765_16750, partial [Bacteroidetes bacterium]